MCITPAHHGDVLFLSFFLSFILSFFLSFFFYSQSSIKPTGSVHQKSVKLKGPARAFRCSMLQRCRSDVMHEYNVLRNTCIFSRILTSLTQCVCVLLDIDLHIIPLTTSPASPSNIAMPLCSVQSVTILQTTHFRRC